MLNTYRDFGSATLNTADLYSPNWELHTSYNNDIRLVRNEKSEGAGLFARAINLLFKD